MQFRQRRADGRHLLRPGFDKGHPGRAAGQRLQTQCAAAATNGQGKLLLDVKGVNIGADIKAALNTANGIDSRVGENSVWPSQNNSIQAAIDFHAAMPNAGILWGAVPANQAEFDDLRSKGIVGFDIDADLVTPEFLFAAHAQVPRMDVIAFTILSPDKMLEMIDRGVDGMETDYPGILDSLMPPPLQ